MLTARFEFIGQYCIGEGLEFGEYGAAVTDGKQFRNGRFVIAGKPTSNANPDKLAFADNCQHFVCCIHYLEHYSNPEPILKEWWRVLSDGGLLAVVLPEAGLYPPVGKSGCNPDHKVDFTLISFKAMLESLNFVYEIVAEGLCEESFYLVVKKMAGEVPVGRVPKYSVVIPYYQKQTMTAECVDSIWANCKPDEIICVNDGSDSLVRATNVRHVKLGRNYGFPKAVNEGVKAAKNEFVVILNNDTLMKPHGLERLVYALRDPLVGMAGQDGGKLDDEFRHAGKVWANPDYIEMSCCAVRKAVWERVGPLDEGMGRGYGEDSDWGIRARKLGYKLVTVPNCCKHFEGKTFTDAKEKEALIERNLLRLKEKYYRGRALWVMASLGCNGGSKVVQKMAQAMQDDGWKVDVCSFVPWETAAEGWETFGHETQKSVYDHRYDVVISTYVTTMPFARQVMCDHRFALIQSDEPEWVEGGDKKLKENFMLSGFKHIIIADHMKSFAKKYGMNIVGQLDNGVDSLTFHPTWTMEREWSHRVMVVWKGARAWFNGLEYFEAAVVDLAKKYNDLEVLVLGKDKPKLPCKVENVKTYDPEEIRDMYNRCSCIVVPSLIEGSSLVPLEAMASGTPVISTEVGMHYAKDGQDYLMVPYKDSRAIVKAVSRVFDDDKLRGSLYKHGLRLAKSRTWQKEQQQFLAILKKEMAR